MNTPRIELYNVSRAWRTPRKPADITFIAIFVSAITTLIATFFIPLGLGTIFWGAPRPPFAMVAFVTLAAGMMFAVGRTTRWSATRWAGAFAHPAALLTLVMLAAAFATGLVAVLSLTNFPNSGDEYAYLFQAWTYEAGRLVNPAPAFGQRAAASYTWVFDGIWVGQYPPGWPVLVAAAHLAGLPIWSLNAALLGATAWMVHDLVRREAGSSAGLLAAAVFLLSPFSIFQAASFFSHVFAAFLVTGAIWTIRKALEHDRVDLVIMAGAIVGILGVTRTSSAAIVAAPLVVFLLRRQPRFALAFACSGAPFLAGLLWYQQFITGSAFTPIYYMGGRTIDRLYFELGPILLGVTMTIARLVEIGLWISPLALPLWLIAARHRIEAKRFDAIDAIFPFTMLVLIFYPLDGGNRYGPRYFFEFWPLALVTIGAALPTMSNALRRFCGTIALATIAYGLILIPFLAHDYHAIVVERTEPFRLAAAMKLDRAVVCFVDTNGMLPLAPEDYPRNGIVANGRAVFARCDRSTPALIRETFPGYALWYYDRGPNARFGRIVPADSFTAWPR